MQKNKINDAIKTIKNIGFIGLGSMGYPMALSLIHAGFNLTVYDVRDEPVDALCQEGAQKAVSPQALAANQDVIITMLQTGDQVRHVCLGEHGIYLNAAPGTLHIDTSSIDVETSRELHESAEMAGLLSLDAPVSGGVTAAANGQLTFAVGGEELVLTQALPVLEAMGKRMVHTGGPGNGQAAKICNNMILGISMIAISEAFTLGKRLGLSPEKFFEFASNASGQCWSMTHYAPVPGLVPEAPSNNHYKPGFAAQLMLKDLHLSQLAAESVELKTPLGEHAEALYKAFVERLDMPVDFSGIIKMLAK